MDENFYTEYSTNILIQTLEELNLNNKKEEEDMADRIIQRNDTLANWNSINPVLAKGELGIITDTGGYKIGDGVSKFQDLPYPQNPTQVVDELGDGAGVAIGQKVVTDNFDNVGIDEYQTFSASKAYVVGDVVMYEGLLYKFNVEHPAGEWIGTDAERTSLKGETDEKLTELENKVKDLQGKIDALESSLASATKEDTIQQQEMVKKEKIVE